MALGGIVRGTTTTLRTPVEDDLVSYGRWMADLRLRRLAGVWHEPAMPATWKERLVEQTKEKDTVLFSIEAEGRLVGLLTVENLGEMMMIQAARPDTKASPWKRARS